MPTILVTNDDGVHSPGLLRLKEGLSEIADVIVLAPERNWSATGHSKTMHKPMRIHDVLLADGSPAYSCSGGPTDCVALAIEGAVERRPDLVVSGINNGYNLGSDVTYSGTVACALEATLYGVPGIAVSTASTAALKASGSEVNLMAVYTFAAHYAALLAQLVLRRQLPAGTLLNVNVPAIAPDQVRGVEVTRLGKRRYEDELIKREDPFGRPYYWLGGTNVIEHKDDGTDVGAIANGLVSVTPISLDLTDYNFLQQLQQWELPKPVL